MSTLLTKSIDALWRNAFAYNRAVVSRLKLLLENEIVSQDIALRLAGITIMLMS